MSECDVVFSGSGAVSTFGPIDEIALIAVDLEGTASADGRWVLGAEAQLPKQITGGLWVLSASSWVESTSTWRPFGAMTNKYFSQTESLVVELRVPPGEVGPACTDPVLFLRCVSTDPDFVVEGPPFDFTLPASSA